VNPRRPVPYRRAVPEEPRLKFTDHTPDGAEKQEPLARLVNVHKRFGSQVVLNGVDLDILPAQTTVIMGPSGCGKSVTLKHLVGLLKPDEGEVHFDGRRIDTLAERDLEPVRLQIGMVFQMGALFDSMSVRDNIDFPLVEHTHLSRRDRDQRIDEALETVDLHDVHRKLPAQLSGGQRKRVAIARALVMRPRAILFDEPTTGLDPIRSDGINELILKLRKQFGVTNVVVTHDLASAQKISDRVVMMLGGKIVADGTYADLTHSKDVRIQHFLTGVYDKADEGELPEAGLATRRLR
jgi:phospholipid/cholesterol/gamma-HCH transport system ATP-binding protein